jgi:hypothetical protein
VARVVDLLIRKYGRNGEGAQAAQPVQQSARETGATEGANNSQPEKDTAEARVKKAMEDAEKDVESLLENADKGGEMSDAEKAFRNNTIANLHINDAWLREQAGVDPSTLKDMSTKDLSALFDRFVQEKAASYRSEADRAKAEQANAEQDKSEQDKAEQDRADAEQREKKRKKLRFGKRIAACLVAVGILGGGLFAAFGNKKGQANNKGTTHTTATMRFDDSEFETSDDALRNLTGESAEAEEGPWDAATGNDARGLFADENDPTRVNPDKLGEHNLVDDEEFANEDLSTEQGVKNFKEHFVKVNERQAVNMAMFADYMQLHGGDKYIPDSLKGLSGEALEDAIVENKDGCYDDLCKSYEDFVNNAKVRKGSLEAGKYTNYYAKQINPDQIMTKDNIELYSTTTFEKDGTPVFVFEDSDGLIYTVKQVCAQAILEITGNPVNPPTETTTPPPTETTTPPPETTTPPPETTTPPPTETTTPPPETTTPPPETTTPPPSYDDSKDESGLARGQGGFVNPTEAGAREAENMSQQDYDPAHNTPETPSAESQRANQDQAGDVNDTAQGAAERQQRQEAAAQQEQINQERNNDQAAQPNYDALNSDTF